MNKIFHIYVDEDKHDIDYDQYYAFVVVADTKEKAINYITDSSSPRSNDLDSFFDENGNEYEYEYVITKEIGIANDNIEAGIVSSSFMGG